MSANDKIIYNKSSSLRWGWEPEWFDADDFDEELVEKVKEFQEECSLDADGLVGPMTFRRLVTHRAFESFEDESYIVCNGSPVSIDWDKVIVWTEPDSLLAKRGRYRRHRKPRDPSIFVVHWDVCLSSKTCEKILNKRGISVHFCIDNDGTIYQLLDTQHIAWHAGNRSVNNASVGVEISNAYYTKYQEYYEQRGFGSRPIVEDAVVHGIRLKPHLGFYPVQIEALKALTDALNKAHDIPLECPVDDDGNMLNGVCSDAASADFAGVVHHYHLTNRKIDCAGVDLVEILEDVKGKETN
tara:strand:- start:2666 stop:3559 length:894 start_codon:yes stop_codon:yes gene_type:complete